jgi:hypothetical protein
MPPPTDISRMGLRQRLHGMNTRHAVIDSTGDDGLLAEAARLF